MVDSHPIGVGNFLLCPSWFLEDVRLKIEIVECYHRGVELGFLVSSGQSRCNTKIVNKSSVGSLSAAFEHISSQAPRSRRLEPEGRVAGGPCVSLLRASYPEAALQPRH